MNQKAQNRLNMWRAVLKTCNEANGAWENIPAFAAAVDQLTQMIGHAESQGAIQQKSIPGATQTKEEFIDDLVTKVLNLAGAVRAYTIDNTNPALATQANLYRYSLIHAPDSERKDIIQAFLNTIDTPAATALVQQYGVAPTAISDISAQMVTLGDMIALPRTTIVNRKTATSGISGIMSSDRALFIKLDGIVRNLRDTFPVFVSRYYNARIIVDAGMHHEQDKPKGNSKDSASSTDINNSAPGA